MHTEYGSVSLNGIRCINENVFKSNLKTDFNSLSHTKRYLSVKANPVGCLNDSLFLSSIILS